MVPHELREIKSWNKRKQTFKMVRIRTIMENLASETKLVHNFYINLANPEIPELGFEPR